MNEIIIIHDKQNQVAAFGCESMDYSFGPIIRPNDSLKTDAAETAQAFLKYLASKGVQDPRGLNALTTHYHQFLLSIENGDRPCGVDQCGEWVKDTEGAICCECRQTVCNLHNVKLPCNLRLCETCALCGSHDNCQTCQSDALDERLLEKRKADKENEISDRE